MPPDRNGRLAILRIHANGKGDHKFKVDDKQLQDAADVTFGYTGADLVGLLNAAFTKACLRDSTDVTPDDMKHALSKTKPSALRDMPFREPKTKFADLGGYADHKEVLRRIVQHSNGSVMLFYGPKGTGKTAFAEALAGEYGYNLIHVSGSEPEDKFVGETEKTIDRYLERAKQLAPCVLCFDEMDSLVEKRGSTYTHKSGWTGLLQSKLSRPIDGVYIIGTVNRPDQMGKTFLDRFTHKLYFPMPTLEEQLAIWQVYLPKGIDARSLVKINAGLSCRDIARCQRIALDYGLEPTQAVFEKMVTGVASDASVDYSKTVKETGDSVADYKSVKAMLVQPAQQPAGITARATEVPR